MRRLGVAFVIHNIDTTGGMERQARRLAEALVKRGGRVWIVSTFRVMSWVPRLPRGVPFTERDGRLTVHRIPLCEKWRWTWCEAFYEVVGTAILARHAPALDAIYAVHLGNAVQTSRLAAVLDCPFFVKFAGGGINGEFSRLAEKPERPAVLAALARAEGLVCISPQITAEARAAGLPAEKILSIPNGVDLARFEQAREAALPGPEDAERVLFVGALRREKRLPDLIRAFARVAVARPRARLVLAGDGPEEEAVRAAVREHGLEERVDILGRRADVPELLKAANVFVLYTESEGLSNALLEALAAGAPVVATDVEGNTHVVAHEREALLVPLGDEAALAAALVRVLEDRTLADRLRTAGLERARRYGMPSVAQRYERAFREASRRPLPSSLALARRYLGSSEGLGVTGIALGLARYALGECVIDVKGYITSVVLFLKRMLGIEREILGRSRADRP